MIKRILSLLLFISVIACISVKAQTALSVKSIIAAADTFRNRMPAEKLYMQFDKPYYSAGDTVWFKAYLFDADFLKGSQRSGIVYIELANDTNKVLLQRLLPLAYGIGWGNIVLNKDDVPEGSYTIRAYTNLMRNFGEDLVFKKSFYVSGNALQNWLVTSNVNLFKQGAKDSIRMALQFNRLDKQILGLRDMEIRVLEGRRTLFRDKVQTAGDGTLDINFSLPEKADARKIFLLATDLTKNEDHKVIVPIPVNRPENMDLQFLPEGGNLVAGIAARIGFKALGEDGLGTDVKGKIYNNTGVEISEFQSSYKGMGVINISPKTGESYTAKVALPDGSFKIYPLPEVKAAGSSLNIRNSGNTDSLELTITLPAQSVQSWFLVAESRGIICYGAVIRSSNQRKIAKALFPTGITKFSLLNSDKQILNERAVFIDHHDNLELKIIPDKASYKAKDSIALSIEVKDHEGNPIQGSFSVAVTDNNQIKADSLENNILSSLLLTSDLKGDIEQPGHYFLKTEQAAADLDNLLLTQGWKNYQDLSAIFNPAVPLVYAAEKELSVRGKVLNVFNKPLPEVTIQLLSSRPLFFKDTITNKNGSFSLSNFPPADTLTFLIQARNKKEKSSNVGVEVEEFKAPVFKTDSRRFMPWYVNTDSTLLKYINISVLQQEELLRPPDGSTMLKAVTVVSKKIIKGSKNLNGEGNADLFFEEKDLQKTQKLSLLEVLERRFPSFQEIRYEPDLLFSKYKLFYRDLRLVIDGVYIDTALGQYPYLIQRYLTSEDIKGIEVMTSNKYKQKYWYQDFHRSPFSMPDGFTYLEITTFSGHGAWAKKTPGTYFYRSIPFVGRQEFYRPKYTAKKIAQTADLRSTIHWDPNVITDKNGKGFVSFYAAGNPGIYTIITEGSDMYGNIGNKSSTIKIDP